MYKLFATIFGSRKRPHLPAQARLGVEELSPRMLPSAGVSGLCAGRMADHAFVAAARGTDEPDAHEGHQCGEAHASLAASLSNATGATGTATFSNTDGALKVGVTGAAASTSLAVTVDGTSVGSLTTDASGNGTAKFTGVTASAGSVVMVGDLTGTLAQVKFTATLTGDAGLSGSASFNSLNGQLKVSASGLTSGTTYDVALDGTTVGQITGNAAGRGKLHVSPTGISITAGTIVTLTATGGTAAVLTGTFA